MYGISMFSCGQWEHKAWKQGHPLICKVLGSYNPETPVEEIEKKFEHEKLDESARKQWRQGWITPC